LARRPARASAHPFPAAILSGRLPEEKVKEFAPHTPPKVVNWLRGCLAATPGHPVLRALACDDRMSDLWVQLGPWKPNLWLVQLTVHFSTPTILSALKRPVQERDSIVWSEYQLGIAAYEFAVLLEAWRDTAAELWGGSVDVLIERLYSFMNAAFDQGISRLSVYDYVPEPARRGRGVREQLAFREALSSALERICKDHPLPQEKRDLIVATITSMVSPGWDVDP
jgi:hypothetical protein